MATSKLLSANLITATVFARQTDAAKFSSCICRCERAYQLIHFANELKMLNFHFSVNQQSLNIAEF